MAFGRKTGEVDRHTFDCAGAGHIDDGFVVGVAKTVVLGIQVSLSGGGNVRGVVVGGRDIRGREGIEIAGSDVAGGNGRSSSIGEPAASGVEMTGVGTATVD